MTVADHDRDVALALALRSADPYGNEEALRLGKPVVAALFLNPKATIGGLLVLQADEPSFDDAIDVDASAIGCRWVDAQWELIDSEGGGLWTRSRDSWVGAGNSPSTAGSAVVRSSSVSIHLTYGIAPRSESVIVTLEDGSTLKVAVGALDTWIAASRSPVTRIA